MHGASQTQDFLTAQKSGGVPHLEGASVKCTALLTLILFIAFSAVSAGQVEFLIWKAQVRSVLHFFPCTFFYRVKVRISCIFCVFAGILMGWVEFPAWKVHSSRSTRGGEPCPPRFVQNHSFLAIFLEKTQFWANLGSGPPWGQNSELAPLTKILDPPLVQAESALFIAGEEASRSRRWKKQRSTSARRVTYCMGQTSRRASSQDSGPNLLPVSSSLCRSPLLPLSAVRIVDQTSYMWVAGNVNFSLTIWNFQFARAGRHCVSHTNLSLIL